MAASGVEQADEHDGSVTASGVEQADEHDGSVTASGVEQADVAAAPVTAMHRAWWRRQVLTVGAGLRPLPWRATRDPWRVLVSEVMLQQTQASRVVGPWRSFVDRFPDPAACAAAPPSEVVRAWAGLGFNRRALQLRRAATAAVDHHGGQIPGDLDALLALPGVGAYTSRAVLAFAFERPVAVVDTNVRRVVRRALSGRPLAPSALQQLAGSLVPGACSWEYNQALMEIGALVCTSRHPACDRCPLARRCWWHQAGHRHPDPASPTTRQSRFVGSDRQGRGRLVAALRAGPVPASELAAAAGWPEDVERASRVAATLVADGLVVVDSHGTARLA